ncbi:MAG: SBBP repeat-containing protein [Gemmatimonadetes bacterium]|nr:SBBP repeat-containing protein [Gemmatimonadota bacterium]
MPHLRPISALTSTMFFFAAAAATAADPPSVQFETTLAGYTIPHARDVVVDAAGNSYLIGSAYQDGHSLDVLVAKVDATGNVAWTKYIVSSSHNYATGIALAPDGDVWVAGWTDSPDFPLVNPMDATFQAREIFLMRLAPDTGALEYSTFLGGDYTDTAEGLAIDDTGAIWLTGQTGSTDFPTTPDAYQPEPSLPLYFFADAYLTKLSPEGDQILYSTYFGGQEDDGARRIVLDSAGNPIIAGDTDAADFPLVGALQTSPNDLFVSKFSADGHTLLFSSYFGGEDLDRLGDLAIDAADHLYLVGSTRSVSFPTTPGAFQETFVGGINACEVPFGADYNCEDLFVTKLAADGSSLVWSSYLGGTRVEEGRGIAVDASGRAYVTGYTNSPDFPLNHSSFAAEILVSRFAVDGSDLDLTFTVDSGSANRGNGIAVDSAGDVYFTGTVGVPASVYLSKLGMSPQTTDVAIGAGATELALGRPSPNPFEPSTRIEYVVPGETSVPVRLRVYDVAGQLVRELVNGVNAPGRHAATWDGVDGRGVAVASGVYFVRLEASGQARTGKVVKLDR